MSSSGTQYLTGEVLYRHQNNNWATFLLGTNSLYSFGIYGTSDDNLFVVGQLWNQNKGAVYHYNGSDWISIKELELPDISYYNVWTDGKEVFIVGEINSKSVVLHGK